MGTSVRRRGDDSASLYLKSCVEFLAGSVINEIAIYSDYREWCAAIGLRPLDRNAFAARLEALGVDCARIAGRARYLHVALRSA
jgi:hypothetical protein